MQFLLANHAIFQCNFSLALGRIVQLPLDRLSMKIAFTRSRNRRKNISLLPSSGHLIDIYNNSQKFGAHLKDQLIHIPDDDLLQKYDCPCSLQFSTDDTIHLMEQIYWKIESPELSARLGWSVFVEMVNLYIELQTGSVELRAIEDFDSYYHVFIVIKLYRS